LQTKLKSGNTITKNEIIRMAKDLSLPELKSEWTASLTYKDTSFDPMNVQALVEERCRLAVIEEREACARVCEDEATKWEFDGQRDWVARLCSVAIRARSTP